MGTPFKVNSTNCNIPLLKDDLKSLGFKLNVSTRKTALGIKRYFKVKYNKKLTPEEKLIEAYSVLPKTNLMDIRILINKYFPDAYMSSGSIWESTFAEW